MPSQQWQLCLPFLSLPFHFMVAAASPSSVQFCTEGANTTRNYSEYFQATTSTYMWARFLTVGSSSLFQYT